MNTPCPSFEGTLLAQQISEVRLPSFSNNAPSACPTRPREIPGIINQVVFIGRVCRFLEGGGECW